MKIVQIKDLDKIAKEQHDIVLPAVFENIFLEVVGECVERNTYTVVFSYTDSENKRRSKMMDIDKNLCRKV